MRKMFSKEQIKKMIEENSTKLKKYLVSVEFDDTDDVGYQTSSSGVAFIPQGLNESIDNAILTCPIILHDDTDEYDWILLGFNDDNSVAFISPLNHNVENKSVNIQDIIFSFTAL